MEKETQNTEAHVLDYKNINEIKTHTNAHARMHSRKRTHMTAAEQRRFATAVNAPALWPSCRT